MCKFNSIKYEKSKLEKPTESEENEERENSFRNPGKQKWAYSSLATLSERFELLSYLAFCICENLALISMY